MCNIPLGFEAREFFVFLGYVYGSEGFLPGGCNLPYSPPPPLPLIPSLVSLVRSPYVWLYLAWSMFHLAKSN